MPCAVIVHAIKADKRAGIHPSVDGHDGWCIAKLKTDGQAAAQRDLARRGNDAGGKSCAAQGVLHAQHMRAGTIGGDAEGLVHAHSLPVV